MHIDILEVLMENDITIVSDETKNQLVADSVYILGGEFVVYPPKGSEEIYRGDDFYKALEYLIGE